MQVHVIGAGAVGLLVAGFVVQAGQPVVVVTRTTQQARRINENGIVIHSVEGIKNKFHVKATSVLQVEAGDMVIITVKYGHLQTVYEALQSQTSDIALLFLQNGLAHYEEVLQLSAVNLAFGSAQFGVQKKDANTVVHRGIGILKCAIARGDERRFSAIFKMENEQFPVQIVKDAQQMLFEKALLNCFINPITAILDVKNGQLIENVYAFSLLKQLYGELIEVFPSMEEKFPFQAVYELCERTATNTSSMLADKLSGNKTEAVSIIGAVLKRANQPLPTLQTLYYLILAIDNGGRLDRCN